MSKGLALIFFVKRNKFSRNWLQNALKKRVYIKIGAVLSIKIHELRDPEPEKTIEVSPFYKGIRYDVFVKETGPDGETLRSFDIEMQMEDTKEIPKRTRYYQSMCDSEALNKGEVYYNLKELYIVFPHRG